MWLAIFAGHIAFEIHETPRVNQVRLLCLEGTDRCLSWEEFHFKKH